MLNTYLWTLMISSFITTILYACDKINSQNEEIKKLKQANFQTARLCEFYALISIALGGAFGAILGSIFFNHKANVSKKWYYWITIIISTVVQMLILLSIFEVITFN